MFKKHSHSLGQYVSKWRSDAARIWHALNNKDDDDKVYVRPLQTILRLYIVSHAGNFL